MSDFDDANSGLPSRRAVIGAAAWSVPVIALVTAMPAFAASVSPSIHALQLGHLSPWDLNVGGNGGPIGLNLQVDYSKSSTNSPDTISFTWALTVSGPAGPGTVKSGADTIVRYGTWRKGDVLYPDRTTNLARGTYDFTFTVSVAGSGSKSSTRKMKI